MKWITKLALFSVLLTALLFVKNDEGKAFRATESPKKSIEQVDFLKASAFRNPEISVNSISNPRADLPIYAKWFESFYKISFSEHSSFKAITAFLRQDINRCLNVSILLFPFHIFW
jgi:hypothetical protein